MVLFKNKTKVTSGLTGSRITLKIIFYNRARRFVAVTKISD